ncbi:hypothetical protein HDU99_006632 [Rhizoclosmatium hyalinum]|nr:hypothetical protein HDU99_006632 [Rhizoclosmatium hyalinum]
MDKVFVSNDQDFAIALQELKKRVAANKHTANANLSESLLKRTLWAKHNDLKSSEALLVAYANWHLKTLGNASARLSIKDVHPFLLTGILQSLPGCEDVDSLPVVYMRPNKYYPNQIPWQHVVNALVYLLEVTTGEQEKAAKYGFTFVCDMQDWGWSNFGTTYAAQFFSILSGRFPVRIRKFVLVNPPSLFPMVWKLIKPMMGEELASKFCFATSTTVGEVVKVQGLPAEVGGLRVEDGAIRMKEWVVERCRVEGVPYKDIPIQNFNWKESLNKEE